MEKALSMFSEDFGGFMRPHSEPLAFPGKRSGPVGRGAAQGGTTRCHCASSDRCYRCSPVQPPGQMWPNRQTWPGRAGLQETVLAWGQLWCRVPRGLGPDPLWSPESCGAPGRHAEPLQAWGGSLQIVLHAHPSPTASAGQGPAPSVQKVGCKR